MHKPCRGRPGRGAGVRLGPVPRRLGTWALPGASYRAGSRAVVLGVVVLVYRGLPCEPGLRARAESQEASEGRYPRTKSEMLNVFLRQWTRPPFGKGRRPAPPVRGGGPGARALGDPTAGNGDGK